MTSTRCSRADDKKTRAMDEKRVRSRRNSSKETFAREKPPFVNTSSLEEGINTTFTMVDVTAPVNFGIVAPQVYRSGYPVAANFEFIRGLKLKTMLTLVKKDEPDAVLSDFIHTSGITQVFIDMKGTKKEAIPSATMSHILAVLTDRRNYPLMIHCNHGKHRTGCAVAAYRKLAGWDLAPVLEEYRRYAEPKVRDCDVEYITAFRSIAIKRRVPRGNLMLRAFVLAFIVMSVWFVSGMALWRGHGEVMSRKRSPM